MFRKNRGRVIVGTLVITIASGCWQSGRSPTPLTNTAAPRAKDPIKPEVTEAELGVWDGDAVFQPAADVPLYTGSTFGWRINVPCPRGRVTVDEELRLPAPGDWPDDPEMHISADQRSVTLHYQAECRDGWIEKRWSVSPGDPPGVWVVRVTVDGFATRTFRASFHQDVSAPAPGP